MTCEYDWLPNIQSFHGFLYLRINSSLGYAILNYDSECYKRNTNYAVVRELNLKTLWISRFVVVA